MKKKLYMIIMLIKKDINGLENQKLKKIEKNFLLLPKYIQKKKKI